MKKQHIYILAALVVIAAVAGYFYWNKKQGQKGAMAPTSSKQTRNITFQKA